MTDFTTVFEITRGHENDILMVPVGIVCFILGVILLIKKKRKDANWLEKFFAPLFLLVFGSLWVFISVSDRISYSKMVDDLVSAYENGRYIVTEGYVNVLHEQPESGHSKGDIVSINGKDFEINYFVQTPAYRQTISHGGALKEGVYAKVYCYKGQILRVDVLAGKESELSDVTVSSPDMTKESDEDFLKITWKDQIWISCIVAVNILFFARKIILAKYGYGFGFIDYGKDHKRLSSIAASEVIPNRRLLFKAINILIPVLFILAVIVLILARVVFE